MSLSLFILPKKYLRDTATAMAQAPQAVLPDRPRAHPTATARLSIVHNVEADRFTQEMGNHSVDGLHYPTPYVMHLAAAAWHPIIDGSQHVFGRKSRLRGEGGIDVPIECFMKPLFTSPDFFIQANIGCGLGRTESRIALCYVRYLRYFFP